MAPIPEDNQDKPPNGGKEDSDIEPFSNTNLPIPVEVSDSSDSDDSEYNFGAPNGYSLLPQEPGDDYGVNSDDEDIYSSENAGDSNHYTSSASGETFLDSEERVPSDVLVDSFLLPEAGAAAPTASVSDDSCHSAFLARFPNGKIPSYLQLPKMPRDKEEHLWNQQRPESSKLDPVNASKILKAMSEFSLPSENIPDWARNLPDDQWQQQVIFRIGAASGRARHSADTRPTAPSSSAEERAQTRDSSACDNMWVADFPDIVPNDIDQKE